MPISLAAAAPLAENVGPPRPITFNTPGVGGGGRMRGGFGGAPRWLDGEHWLAVKDGRLMKVHAATGRSQPFVDAKALAKGLARLSSLDPSTVQSIAGRTSFDMDPAKRGFLFEHGQDLYYATFDGSHGGSPDQQSRARAVPSVQPRRQVGRVRARFRPLRGRHRRTRPNAG